LFVAGATQLRDPRHLLVALLIALVYYRSARIPFREVRTQWLYLTLTITFVVGMNTILTGGRAGGFSEGELHPIFVTPILGLTITAEAVSLAVSQTLRFMSIIAMSMPIAYAIAPGDIAVAFRRMGLGDRFAFALDMTIRFVPTLVDRFAETIDAQRVRGYDPTARGGGPITRIRRLAPIFVPVTVGAIVDAEDTIDGLDLRGFGTGRRTWYRHLQFDRTDYLLTTAFVLLFCAATFLNLTGRSEHYLLPFLLR
jgi:energy-coupling factor transport system permease protein